MITLITTGGGRPEAFKLCEKYVARQTYKGDVQWIVADDNPNDPVKCTMGQEHIFGALPWKMGFNTLRYNLAAAIPLIKGEYIFIIENDDYYAPKYIEVFLDFLKHAQMVGECDVTYVSLRSRGYKEMKNYQHASTCQTAFRRSYLPIFERAVHSGNQFFDIFLWNTARLQGHKTLLFSGMNLCVGMKGLPGRSGIGVGHTDNDFIPDKDFIKLKQLIGPEDAKPYIQMVNSDKPRSAPSRMWNTAGSS